MSKPKFTPGPWSIEYSLGSLWIKIKGGGCFAKMLFTDLPPDEATAHLIAAGPDLYAALDDAVSDLFYQISNMHGPEAASKYPSIIAARAALAKARGET